MGIDVAVIHLYVGMKTLGLRKRVGVVDREAGKNFVRPYVAALDRSLTKPGSL